VFIFYHQVNPVWPLLFEIEMMTHFVGSSFSQLSRPTLTWILAPIASCVWMTILTL
jgi:hypothetical protein